MAKKDIKPLPIVLGIVFTAVGLSYLFWGLDLIPDGKMGVIGYLDDAAVMIALWVMFARAKKKIK